MNWINSLREGARWVLGFVVVAITLLVAYATISSLEKTYIEETCSVTKMYNNGNQAYSEYNCTTITKPY